MSDIVWLSTQKHSQQSADWQSSRRWEKEDIRLVVNNTNLSEIQENKEQLSLVKFGKV